MCRIKKIITFLVFGAVSLLAFPAPNVQDEKSIAKTLESNATETTIVASIGIQKIQAHEDGNLLITMTKDSKGKNNPTVLSGRNFIIKGGIELEYINQRLEYASLPSFKVEFVLESKNPKTYLLKKIEGIETVDQYLDRLSGGELSRQRQKNEKEGLGKITDQQVQDQRKANSKKGLGEITDAEVAAQRSANSMVGQGMFTDEELRLQAAANEKAGLGNITDAEKKYQIRWNEKSGLGSLTDAQVESQRLQNRSAGLGDVTDYQVEIQKEINRDSLLGDVTDYEAEVQKMSNESQGLGKLTDAQVREQKAVNKSAGLGEITDPQVELQKAANEDRGLGYITDYQASEQKSLNKSRGLGEITDWQVELQKNANEREGLGRITDHQASEQRSMNKSNGYGEITDRQLETRRQEEEEMEKLARLQEEERLKIEKRNAQKEKRDNFLSSQIPISGCMLDFNYGNLGAFDFGWAFPIGKNFFLEPYIGAVGVKEDKIYGTNVREEKNYGFNVGMCAGVSYSLKCGPGAFDTYASVGMGYVKTDNHYLDFNMHLGVAYLVPTKMGAVWGPYADVGFMTAGKVSFEGKVGLVIPWYVFVSLLFGIIRA